MEKNNIHDDKKLITETNEEACKIEASSFEYIYTFIMPCFNSSRTIEDSLKSIREQDFDQTKVEILVLDGGSTDNTREIANKYQATIVDNPYRLPEFAKRIGFDIAKGAYLVFLDSDESLANNQCLKRRLEVFERYPQVKILNSTGGPAPALADGVNRYAVRVGDSFSNFVYHFYNGADYLKTMTKQFSSTKIPEGGYIFDYKNASYYPLFDGQATTCDTKFARELQRKLGIDDITTDLFCTIAAETGCSAILENDYIIHNQNMNGTKFLGKVKWKIKNNLFGEECVGYSARANTQTHLNKRKYLFIPYCLFVVPPLINAIRLAITEKDVYMLTDFLYTEATFFMICWYMGLKILHVPVKMDKSYGKR